MWKGNSSLEEETSEAMVEMGKETQILEDMTDVELFIKYQAYQEAVERLKRLIDQHPNYLPARESLMEIYHKKGEAEKATQIKCEIVLIREQLAQQAMERDPQTAGAPEQARRRLNESIDEIVKALYHENDLGDLQRTVSQRLVETLLADRCLIIRFEKAQQKAKGFEYCRKGIASSFHSGSTKLHNRLVKMASVGSELIVIDDTLKDPRLLDCKSLIEASNIRSLLAFPLIFKSEMIGLILVHRCLNAVTWSQTAQTLFATVAGHLAVALNHAQEFNTIQSIAITDNLTGVYNRRFLDERLSVEIRNAQQQRYPLSLALLDIDHFKAINDSYGHAAGDNVLQKLGLLLRTHLRKGSVVARYGGEEFAVVLPNTVQHTAHFILENIRRLVEESIRTEDGKRVTVSIGVFEANLDDRGGLEVVQRDLLLKADENLYRAKQGGRNQVCSISNQTAKEGPL
jgi:diguanylate cyclase (GGDEF)-like protein